MYIEFESTFWFETYEEDQYICFRTNTSDGDTVAIKVRKNWPYNKHLKNLIEEITKLLK